MIRACTALAIALLLPTGPTAFANAGACPVDDCLRVVRPRPDTCPAGAVCTRTRPELRPAECYTDLTSRPNARISGEFGEDRDGVPHNGIDIAVRNGTPVFAIKAGIVYRTEDRFKKGDDSTPNGNFVRINNDDGTRASSFISKKCPSKRTIA